MVILFLYEQMGGIIIRKVELTMNEQRKYEVIKKLAETNGSKQRATLNLQLSVRQINRLLKGYKEEGKAFFVHGNHGRKPVNTIPYATRKLVVDLYRTKYFEANFTHYTELLERLEGIKLSVSAVSSILETEYIFSPRVTKSKKTYQKGTVTEKRKCKNDERKYANTGKSGCHRRRAHKTSQMCLFWRTAADGCFFLPLVWYKRNNTPYRCR